MEQPIATAPHASQCRSCKRKDAIPPGDSRVTCDRCREQRRRYQQQKRLRDLEEKASLLLSSNRDGKEAIKEPGETNSEMKKQERKHVSSVDLPGLPLSKKKKKRLSGKSPWTEYQTADGLYETLRDLMSSSLLPEFRGRFSIVMDLKIDHLKRASAVAHNLRTIARCSIASTPRSVTKGNYVAELRFSCTCLANTDQPTASTARPHSTPLQSSHGSNGILYVDEKYQANGSKLAEALQASFMMDCKGSVRITVETDSSHPLGVVGQRISVLVKH